MDVDPVLERSDRCADGARPDTHEVIAPAKQGFLRHPYQRGLELIPHTRRVVDSGYDLAATDIDLIGQRHSDRLPCDRLLEIAVAGDHPLNGALLARGQGDDSLPGGDRAAH